MILIKDIILNNYNKKYISLKMNINLKMNLILVKELYQEKVLLELLKNVLVNMIIFIMQLNKLNKINNKLILKKLKLVYKFKRKIILLINKIFIIENILEKMIN